MDSQILKRVLGSLRDAAMERMPGTLRPGTMYLVEGGGSPK